MADYLLLEDGVSHLLLEDGTGALLLEPAAVAVFVKIVGESFRLAGEGGLAGGAFPS